VSDLLEHSIVAEAGYPLRSERRRPGRRTDVSPALIPVLRGDIMPSPGHEEGRDSDLAPAIGIAVAIPFCGLFWAILLWII